MHEPPGDHGGHIFESIESDHISRSTKLLDGSMKVTRFEVAVGHLNENKTKSLKPCQWLCVAVIRYSSDLR